MKRIIVLTICCIAACSAHGQEVDAATKLYLTQPQYKVPYGNTTPEAVKSVIDRVLVFLENTTPTDVIDEKSQKTITDYAKINEHAQIAKGRFSLTNYTWGVTYAAMLHAANVTGDPRYDAYVTKRFRFLEAVAPHFDPIMPEEHEKADPQMRQLLRPEALDDAGAMCSAMLQAKLEKIDFDGTALIDRYFDHIYNKEYRLSDGTFARTRPQKNTLWLDDMCMGIPSIAYMGRWTGEEKYYD
ncbi:MAG: glycoside hydrolase family 88 protein, partial [Phaeodactylibacter sp.]|nr:glycoside hydrolase family 88 protein [Phaeodactylibacter sp.]